MELTKKEFTSVIFVEKLKSPLALRCNGKVAARGEEGMFLCRDSVGFMWFETWEHLQARFKLFTKSCGVFVTARATMTVPRKPFLVKSGGKPIVIGEHDDLIISYPFGICYIFRKKKGGKDIVLPVHFSTAKDPSFEICF